MNNPFKLIQELQDPTAKGTHADQNNDYIDQTQSVDIKVVCMF